MVEVSARALAAFCVVARLVDLHGVWGDAQRKPPTAHRVVSVVVYVLALVILAICLVISIRGGRQAILHHDAGHAIEWLAGLAMELALYVYVLCSVRSFTGS